MTYQLLQLQSLFSVGTGTAIGKVVTVNEERITIATPAGCREFRVHGFAVGDLVRIHGGMVKKIPQFSGVGYPL